MSKSAGDIAVQFLGLLFLLALLWLALHLDWDRGYVEWIGR